MGTDKSLLELFTQMGYDIQVMCDDFADATGKPTGTINDYLEDDKVECSFCGKPTDDNSPFISYCSKTCRDNQLEN